MEKAYSMPVLGLWALCMWLGLVKLYSREGLLKASHGNVRLKLRKQYQWLAEEKQRWIVRMSSLAKQATGSRW